MRGQETRILPNADKTLQAASSLAQTSQVLDIWFCSGPMRFVRHPCKCKPHATHMALKNATSIFRASELFLSYVFCDLQELERRKEYYRIKTTSPFPPRYELRPCTST